jgi:hypothetical protein
LLGVCGGYGDGGGGGLHHGEGSNDIFKGIVGLVMLLAGSPVASSDG